MNMDGNAILNGVWTFLNSGIGFAIIWAAMVGFFIFLASKFNPLQEKWKQYEGSIITGIKLAEKQIPDDTPNSGLAKLDAALRFVLKAYAEANSGKQPSDALVEQIKQGIQIKHSELDRWGGLPKPKEAA
ncbi:MAG TPA: hypothetical protein PKG77_21060 [Phycisphaerae bacterium]|nr:hypothetical protein [Phycisphaerae bacterium]